MAKQKIVSFYGQTSRITGRPKTTHVNEYYRSKYNVTAKSIRRETIKIIQNVFPTIHIM